MTPLRLGSTCREQGSPVVRSTGLRTSVTRVSVLRLAGPRHRATVTEGTVMRSMLMETIPTRSGPQGSRELVQHLHREEKGLATAEYGIVMLAAVGFAGLLVAVLSSGTARGLLTGIVERALSF